MSTKKKTKVEEAILFLAESIEEGSWHSVYDTVYKILYPLPSSPKVKRVPKK